MHKSLFALAILGVANVASAAREEERCAPSAPATCYADDCKNCYCLGPDNRLVNAPVYPRTCNGDFVIEVAGLYWTAHQDGMEYAINNHVASPTDPLNLPQISQLNNLIDAEYKTPKFKWDFGFKAGIGYNTTCDGWDLGLNWTWYRGSANDHIEAEQSDNQSLLPLWSAFVPIQGNTLFTYNIETDWKVQLNLIDLELGREYWTSKYLSIRPFVGLRVAYIDQNFEILHKGGSWSAVVNPLGGNQPANNNEVDLSNDFKGVGIRSGLNSTWNLGCGWAIYGDLAASIVYGRFSVDHDETNRRASNPHDKTKILETSESFRASRGMVDLGLGIQWSAMFCDCQYGITVALGWEQHLFFHQNQMWRVARLGAEELLFPNNTGENGFFQRRGTLDTQGATLSVKLEF